MSDQKFLHAGLSCKSVVFGSESASGFDKADVGYAVARRIVFCGTDILGFDLSTAKVIAYLSAGSNAGSIQIYDETNSQIIGQITNILAVTPTIYESGSLSNLPTGEAIWKIEVQGGTGSTIRIEFLSFCCS